MREASYALKATTIRRVLPPSVRPHIAGGVTLGMGRIVGDTAIVVILLGATLHLEGVSGLPGPSTLRGTGGTLTSYVLYNSPAGEERVAEGLRRGVRAADHGACAERNRHRITAGTRGTHNELLGLPSPGSGCHQPTLVNPYSRVCATAPRAAPVRATGVAARSAPARAAATSVAERMTIEAVSLAYGEKWVVRDVSLPCARARCWR